MGFRLSLLTFALALGCASVTAQAPARESGSQTPAPAVTRLPAVPVIGLDRRATSLPVLTRGRPALVALWATWCKSCAEELGELDRLQARVGDRALVVAVAVGEPYETVREFLRPRGLRYAQLVDEEFALADALGSERVPTTLVVDREGAVRYTGGALDRGALEALRAVMEQPASLASAP